MAIFKLTILVLFLFITLYITRKYTKIIKENKVLCYGLYGFFSMLQLLFIARFMHLDVIESTPWLMHVVLFATAFYFTLIILSFLFFILGDIIQLICHKRHIFSIYQKKHYLLLCVFVSFIVSCYGYIHAKQIYVTSYTHTIKKQSKLAKLNIVFISDLHLGNSIHEDELQTIINEINKQKPDIVIYGGDIFDENTSEKQLQASTSYFKQVKATYGSYYIYGNHEFYTSSQERYNEVLKKSNIHILADEQVMIDQSFTIIGRLDHRKNKNRKSLESLLKDVDTSKPIILLDHQPIVDSNKNIDLQLSGHTHNGQIFPGNLLVAFTYENAYGFDKSPYPMITSSGSGTWGIPMRIGSNSEIVYIQLVFEQ